MHALIRQYAELIRQALARNADASFAEKMIVYMKKRGHLSILPAALKKVQAMGDMKGTAQVLLAHADDAKTFAPRIASALATLGAEKGYDIRVDDRAVGGYSVRANGKVIDQSYRKSLVELYQRVISE